jgi:hypothetical protein
MPASLLFSQFMPLPAIKLGRFVTSVDEPYRDYHDPNVDSDFKVIEKIEAHYDGIDSQAGHQNFASELTSLLSTAFSKRSQNVDSNHDRQSQDLLSR